MTLLNSLMVLLTAFQQTQQTAVESEADRVKQALEITTDWAEKYEFQTRSGADVELETEPILRWSNPEQGSIHGNVFLWTEDKRPVAIGSLFKWFAPHTHMSHEFHSLSETSLTVKRTGRIVWEAPAGIEFQPVADAPAVAKTPVGRQSQMRQMSRRLTAKKRERDKSDNHELRLLTTPVYRYDLADGAPVSGAVFLFVQGTDPEIVVWMEARKTDDLSEQWFISFARMNSIDLRVFQRDAEIWRARQMPWGDISAHRKPYTTFSSRRYPIK